MRARPLLLLLFVWLSGCAHWGTSNVSVELPSLPPVSDSYLAPPRPAQPPGIKIAAMKGPPPPGSTVIAIEKARCSVGEEGCLWALLEEARRLGANGLFGVHPETVPRAGTTLIGSATFDPAAAPAPTTGHWTELEWHPKPGDPLTDVELQRRDPADELPLWRPVCQLPCTADVDRESSYRLKAPALASEPPLEVTLPEYGRVQVTTRTGKPDYSRFWLGLGTTLVVGGLSGGTLAYYFANQKSAAGMAELTVGLTVLPYVLYGILEMLEGPVHRVELAATPEP